MELYKVNITSDGVTSKVTVNGIDMSNASAITFRHVAGHPPKVTIELPIDGISIDSPARIEKSGGHTAQTV